MAPWALCIRMDEEDPDSPPGADALLFPEPVPVPAAPMGRGFWAVMTLIGILILLIIYAQIQGITRPVSVNLTGTSWTLDSYTDAAGRMVPVNNGNEVNLSFDPENTTTLDGYAGCNWYSYTYFRYNTTTLQLGNRTSTMRFCDDAGVMQAESAYLRDLNNTSVIRFRSGQITLYDATGKPILIFEQSGS